MFPTWFFSTRKEEILEHLFSWLNLNMRTILYHSLLSFDKCLLLLSRFSRVRLCATP